MYANYRSVRVIDFDSDATCVLMPGFQECFSAFDKLTYLCSSEALKTVSLLFDIRCIRRSLQGYLALL